jgi:hypothetical protein
VDLAQLLKKKGSVLKRLALNSCHLNDYNIRQMSPVLQNYNKSLEVLEMSGNQIDNNGATEIGEIFMYNDTLTTVDLSWNNFKSPGAKGLCEGLLHNRVIQHLNVAWNGLEEAGCSAFAAILRSNASLTNLDLTQTGFGPESCLVLCEAMRHNPQLYTLNLSNNPCRFDGGRHLMVMLQLNDSVRDLGLVGCSFVGKVDANYGMDVSDDEEGDDRIPDGTLTADSPDTVIRWGFKRKKYEFNKHDPEGIHTFSLVDLADRAILGLLLSMEEENPGSMIDVKHNGKKLTVPEVHETNQPTPID